MVVQGRPVRDSVFTFYRYCTSLIVVSYTQIDVHYSLPRDIDLNKACDPEKNQVRLISSAALSGCD